MDNIIFYLGITLFLIACIVIIFGIIAILRIKLLKNACYGYYYYLIKYACTGYS